jgi:hypothetical protein
MQNKDPVPCREKASVADKRKTVVEVCEKIRVDGGGTSGAVKSPPPTPYIEVPNTWVMPFQVSHGMQYNCTVFIHNVNCMFWMQFIFVFLLNM